METKKTWRPNNWESQPPITDSLSLSTRRIFEAGADAMLKAILEKIKLFMDTYDRKRFYEHLGIEELNNA